ncbi:phage virion morphogenesis protein [Pasteurella multocida]
MKQFLQGSLTKQSKKQLRKDLAKLKLDPKTKKMILRNALKRIKKEANLNKRKQQSPDGKPWTPRKKEVWTTTKKGKKKSKKMLMKVLNKSQITVKPDEGTLGFNSEKRSEVAGRHNYGGVVPQQDITAEQQEQKKTVLQTLNDPATEEQAKRLLELGFTEPVKKHPIHQDRELSWAMRKKVNKLWVIRMVKGVNRKPSSINYICNHLTQAQAGVLIGELKKYHGITKKDKNMTPERKFLNEDEQHNSAILTEEINKVIKL